MTHRENALAILNYAHCDQLPVVSFGYWPETLDKWRAEGHVSADEAADYRLSGDNGGGDRSVMRRLGFDFNWNSCIMAQVDLFPRFDEEILETRPDGSKVVRDENGLIVLIKPGVVSIPAEIGTSLTDRKAWEELYLPRMQWTDARVDTEQLKALPPPEQRTIPLGIHCGSLIGTMRNFLGVEQLSYLYADDEDLYVEIAGRFAALSHSAVEAMLATGVSFDFAHYWEDICYKNGPLVTPAVFEEVVGPHYRKTTELLRQHGVNIVSVDCDGMIDALIPIWLQNGVNTMFPIEVGTWDASVAPWRKTYGRQLRGVGGMNKTVFAKDRAAVDREIERLRPLIELGGYLPCPDHRIAPDAEFALVQYYCEKLRALPV